MTPSEYLPLAQRTEKIPQHKVEIMTCSHDLIRSVLERALLVAHTANLAKREMVYENYSATKPPELNPSLQHLCGLLSPAQFRILHALLGKISELGELIECLLPALTTHSSGLVDTVNLAEEMGDDEWYDAILLNVFNISPEAVLQCNIDKLRARYPEKFTEEKAMNRDLDAERAALESR